MEINKVYCLFEQSGTFKNAFKELGIEAEDYDICNDFGETDHQIDIFAEIDKAYEGKPSIFDGIDKMDLVLAFYPCTRFQSYNCMNFQGKNTSMKNWNMEKKIEYSMDLHRQLHLLYVTLCKLFQISLRGGWRLIVENPYTQPHYLTMFFPVKPKLIIKDRSIDGDYYKKPTQFFFINCEPEQNIIMQSLKPIKRMKITNGGGSHKSQVERSLISPQFAARFIKSYILNIEGGIWT